MSLTVLTDRSHAVLRRIITPYCPHLVTEKGVISYGQSSVGYDIRLGSEFRIFTNFHAGTIDPKRVRPSLLTRHVGTSCLIPPNAFVLGSSLETFHMPKDVFGLCLGKSTYARCGIVVNLTPLEPGWVGQLTIEISNTTPLPARVYSGEGISQIVFFKVSPAPKQTYASRHGKYQGQRGVTLAR